MASVDFTDDVSRALYMLQEAKKGPEQPKLTMDQYQLQALKYLDFIEKKAQTREQKVQVNRLRDRAKSDPAFAKQFVEGAKKQETK